MILSKKISLDEDQVKIKDFFNQFDSTIYKQLKAEIPIVETKALEFSITLVHHTLTDDA